MMKEINLIDSSAQKKVNLSQIQKLLLKTAVVMGIVFVIASATGLYFFEATNRKSSQNRMKISVLENEIKKLTKNESYLITIDNRLTEIEKIFEKEPSRTEIFTDLKRLGVPGFTMTSFEMKTKANGLFLNGDCSDSQCLGNFNSKVEELVGDKRYSQANFPGISRNQEGKYSLTIDLVK